MAFPSVRLATRALAIAAVLLFGPSLHAEALTRHEALRIAETYIQHRWTAAPANLRHGKDAAGVEIHTPDVPGGHGDPASDCWKPGQENTGMAYKWGGFDTLESYDAGLRKGRAAGDVYTLEKRRKGEAAVSREAVGIDCSGFVSRCWKLSQKHSTSMLFSICQRLPSTDVLQPADVMNTGEGHVLLFVKWLDGQKHRALFYEAAPFSKTRAAERDIPEMTAAGYQPLRYKKIVD